MTRLILLHGTLLTLLALAVAPGQEEAVSTSGTSVRDIEILLRVGVSGRDVIAHARRFGWPESLSQEQFVALEELEPSVALRAALLTILERGTRGHRGERLWEAASIDAGPEHRLSFLHPRGWHREKSPAASRVALRPLPEREPWLEGPRGFIWVERLEDAGKERASGLARLAHECLASSLGRSELEFEDPQYDRLIGPLRGTVFPLVDGIVKRRDSERRGRVLVSAWIDEATGFAIMAGFVTGLGSEHEDLPEPPRQALARILDSALISRITRSEER
jgi:hypothetical protein